MSSLDPKQLEQIFRQMMDTPPPMEMARAVGGQVIEGLPSFTRNAREITRALGGSAGSTTGSKAAETVSSTRQFLSEIGRHGEGSGAAGTSAQPFTVELSPQNIQNLAAQIGKQGSTKGEGPLASFAKAFSGKYKETAQHLPLHRAAAWAGKHVGDMARDFFGLPPATEAKTTPPANPIADLARANAQKIARFGTPFQNPFETNSEGLTHAQRMENLRADPFGTARGSPTDKQQAKRGVDVQMADMKAAGGEGSKAGFSNAIKPPPAPGGTGAIGEAAGGLAAVGEGAEAAGGIAAGIGGAMGTIVPVVGEIAMVGEVLAKAAVTADQFAKSTMEGNRALAKWSGELSIAAAHSKIGDIQREMHLAQATSGSASALEGQGNALKDDMQPMVEGLQNLKNDLATLVTVGERGLVFLVKFGTIIGPFLDLVNFLHHQGKNADLPMKQLIDFMQNKDRLANARDRAPAAGALASRPGDAENGTMGVGGSGRLALNASRRAAVQQQRSAGAAARRAERQAPTDPGVGSRASQPAEDHSHDAMGFGE